MTVIVTGHCDWSDDHLMVVNFIHWMWLWPSVTVTGHCAQTVVSRAGFEKVVTNSDRVWFDPRGVFPSDPDLSVDDVILKHRSVEFNDANGKYIECNLIGIQGGKKWRLLEHLCLSCKTQLEIHPAPNAHQWEHSTVQDSAKGSKLLRLQMPSNEWSLYDVIFSQHLLGWILGITIQYNTAQKALKLNSRLILFWPIFGACLNLIIDTLSLYWFKESIYQI